MTSGLRQAGLMTVGELSRRTGVPIKNLRQYADWASSTRLVGVPRTIGCSTPTPCGASSSSAGYAAWGWAPCRTFSNRSACDSSLNAEMAESAPGER
jgi:mevalonate pyrophosphate decarboxylase